MSCIGKKVNTVKKYKNRRQNVGWKIKNREKKIAKRLLERKGDNYYGKRIYRTWTDDFRIRST